MTKKIIEETLNEYWAGAIDGGTVAEAIEYLQRFPDDAVLTVDSDGYDAIDSEITLERWETDEEYALRLDKEAAEIERKRLATMMAEEGQRTREEKMLQSKVAQDVAIWAYLQKHKDNPRKGDLDNLYRCMIQLERDGHSVDGAAIRGVRECMEELELLG